jgi:hypothetical protein
MITEILVKKYGKERCQSMHHFINKLSIYYGLPYTDQTLEYFLEDLKSFTVEDLAGCLKRFKIRESTFQIKFNEILNGCMAARKERLDREAMKNQKVLTVNREGIRRVKEMVDKIVEGHKHE